MIVIVKKPNNWYEIKHNGNLIEDITESSLDLDTKRSIFSFISIMRKRFISRTTFIEK